jgi:hypothetical protein
MPRWAVSFHTVVRFGEGWHKRTSEFRFIGRRVDLSEVGVEGEVFDLPLGQIFSVERFQRHTVVAHPFLPVPTHLLVPLSRYFAILLV